jgi:hypothetical protein
LFKHKYAFAEDNLKNLRLILKQVNQNS